MMLECVYGQETEQETIFCLVKYDIDTDTVLEAFGYPEFQTPMGICVTGNGDIYVADSKAKALFVFDKE